MRHPAASPPLVDPSDRLARCDQAQTGAIVARRAARRLATRWLSSFLVLLAAPSLPAAPSVPLPISPGESERPSITEARCPTFSWTTVTDATGYEIAVFRLPAEGDSSAESEAELALHVTLPRGADSWTPSVGHCLERGVTYAWSVGAVTGSDVPRWSSPLRFEVERAVLASAADPDSSPEPGRDLSRGDRGTSRGAPDPPAPDDQGPSADSSPGERLRAGRAEGAVTRVAASTVATPGPVSLRVSADISLGSASRMFKDGSLFAWSDASANTGLGSSALSRWTEGEDNTALGASALLHRVSLENTAIGAFAMGETPTSSPGAVSHVAVGYRALARTSNSSFNVAVGHQALASSSTGSFNTALGAGAGGANLTGARNVAVGYNALASATGASSNVAVGSGAAAATTGGANVAIGAGALSSNQTGTDNIAIGAGAGQLTDGVSNIVIGHPGVAGLSNTLLVGRATGTGYQEIDATYVQGIWARTAEGGVPVVVNSVGKLGTTTSSRRFKQDIQALDESLVARLLALRPVSFRYRDQAAADRRTPLEYGLIAEEVAQVLPELVVLDGEGRPAAVRYQHLDALLLAALQEQQQELEQLRARLESQPRLGRNGQRMSRRCESGRR